MIIKFGDLPKIRKLLRDKKIVFAGGAFDLLHRGHIDHLSDIKKFGDIVCIAVSSNKRIKQRKGSNRPILGQGERVALVNAIRHVDYALIAPEPETNENVPTIQIIDKLKPDIFVTGDKRWEECKVEVEHSGTKLEIIPRKKVNSTSRIIKKIIRRYSKVDI